MGRIRYNHFDGTFNGETFLVEIPVPGDEEGYLTIELPPAQAAAIAKWITQELKTAKAAGGNAPETDAEAAREAFERFWSRYPKKAGKADSWAVWRGKRLTQNLEEIIRDVDRRLESDDGWKKGFILDPVRYLRGRRWEDGAQEESFGGEVL